MGQYRNERVYCVQYDHTAVNIDSRKESNSELRVNYNACEFRLAAMVHLHCIDIDIKNASLSQMCTHKSGKTAPGYITYVWMITLHRQGHS